MRNKYRDPIGIIVSFFLAVIFNGCVDRFGGEKEIKEYYSAYHQSDFSKISALVTYPFSITDGDYVTAYTDSSYYENFKWDSVFLPTYELVQIELQEEDYIATVASTSIRYEFLMNNPLTCRFRFSFEGNKIKSITVVDCPAADWNLWQQERDSLVTWTKKNHPELDGFINDLSMRGAQNYVAAIKRYRENRLSED